MPLVLSLIGVPLVACASVIPRGLKEEVRSVPFAALQQAPERYVGTLLLLGGEVLAVRPRGDWTEIEVLERPLGLRDRPQLDHPSRGEFVVLFRPEPGDARMDQFVPGRLITVVGEMQGRAALPGDIPSDRRVLLMARYVHLWPPPLFPGGPEIGIEFGYQGSIGF